MRGLRLDQNRRQTELRAISRATANRRWEYALSLIAWRLNGRRAPRRRMRYVVERVG